MEPTRQSPNGHSARDRLPWVVPTLHRITPGSAEAGVGKGTPDSVKNPALES